jgi:hypothetical protein
MSKGKGKGSVWVVALWAFETDEATGGRWRRREEVERLDGKLSPAEVASYLELSYARQYQPQWDEALGKVDERALIDAGIIWVGHEPRLRAELVRVALN